MALSTSHPMLSDKLVCSLLLLRGVKPGALLLTLRRAGFAVLESSASSFGSLFMHIFSAFRASRSRNTLYWSRSLAWLVCNCSRSSRGTGTQLGGKIYGAAVLAETLFFLAFLGGEAFEAGACSFLPGTK